VANGRPIIFLLHGTSQIHTRTAGILEVVDPYLDDRAAQEAFGEVERLARKLGLDRRYIYLPSTSEADAIAGLWKALHPEQTLVMSDEEKCLAGTSPHDVYRSGSAPHQVLHYVT